MSYNFCGKKIDFEKLGVSVSLRYISVVKMLYGRDVAEKVFDSIFS